MKKMWIRMLQYTQDRKKNIFTILNYIKQMVWSYHVHQSYYHKKQNKIKIWQTENSTW